MKVTRRALARTLAQSALAASALTGSAVAGAAGPQDETGEDLRSAREQMRNNAEQLAKVHVPMTVEPAFRFKA